MIGETNHVIVRLAYVNAQCLRTKFNLISHFVDSVNIDVLCLCEHWLVHDEAQYYNSIENLKLLNAYFRSSHKNGGVSIYVNSELNVQPVNLDEFCTEVNIEITGVILLDRSLLVLSVYRAPSGNLELFYDALDDCLARLARFNMPIIVGGDFNIPLNSDNDSANMFNYILKGRGLFIANRSPTRGDHCLDTIATSLDSWAYNVEVLDPVIADHCPLLMCVSSELVSANSNNSFAWCANYNRSVRDIADDNLPGFREALLQTDWSAVLHLVLIDPEQAFLMFFRVFVDLFNNFFPAKTLSNLKVSRKHKPRAGSCKDWYSPDLANFRKIVVALHDRYKGANIEPEKSRLYSLYLRTKRSYRRMVDEAKKQANMDIIKMARNPCKAAWNLVSHTTGDRPALKCSASPDEFNKHLLGEVARLVNANSTPAGGTTVQFELPGRVVADDFSGWSHVNPDYLVKLVGKFKNSQSQDIYGMNVILLKYVVDAIAYPLTAVVNACLNCGVFPDILKVTRTVPLYKKGDPEKMDSYRPISIISVFAKVFETVMKNQIVDHFESNNLFSESQHGFRRNRTTVTAVLELVGAVLEAFEAGDSVALTLADLSKAFDCVSHSQLLGKLQSYGVGGVVLQVFRSYLTNRNQVLCIKGAKSRPLPIKCGVPQGSVIGPVLFLVTVNDLDRLGDLLLFADDTTIYSRGSTPGEAGLGALHTFALAKEWFAENRLSLNESKTQVMMCSLAKAIPNSLPNLQPDVKLLGFILDPKLTWKSHTNNVCVKLSRVLYLLRRLKPMLSRQYLLTVYFGMFHSHLIYGLEVWGHASGCRDVFILQKKAVRLISSAGYIDHCRPIFIELGVMSLYSQYIFSSLTNLKVNLSKYAVRNDHHSYNTRRNEHLDLPFCRLSKKKGCFPQLALRMFNHLPQSMKTLAYPEFKSSLKTWLLARPFYSLGEFFDTLF